MSMYTAMEARHAPSSADSRTGLPHSSTLLTGLGVRLRTDDTPAAPLGIGAIQLDRLEQIDREHGPDWGDRLVQAAAERLTGCARRDDVVARRARDQFLLLLDPLPSPEVAASVASKICRVLGRGFMLEGRPVTTTASIGIGLFPDDADDPLCLIEAADAALERARDTGDCFQFAQSMDSRASIVLPAPEDDPRAAFREGRFELYYQPRLDLASGRVRGFEALLRWHDPQRGWIPPARFIPLAESTGLIHEIGEWVLERACTEALAWQARDPQGFDRISVNVSGRQFERADFADRVARVLAHTGLDPRHLELEITESAILHRPDELVATFAQLRAIGVRLALDDFGTGYSALGYLRHFPLDVLKIDRSFVADGLIDGARNDTARVLLRAMIEMAHGLGLRVVAEGVETAAQRSLLAELGCDEIQGFLIAPALEPAACRAYFELRERA